MTTSGIFVYYLWTFKAQNMHSPLMSMKVIHTWLFALLIKHFPNVLLNINVEKQRKYQLIISQVTKECIFFKIF